MSKQSLTLDTFQSLNALQDALINEKKYFQYLFESLPFGIVVLDINDVILDINDAFCDMFGYAKDELIGRFVNDMIVPETLKDDGLLLTDAVSRGENIKKDTKRVRSDGSFIHVAITGQPITLPSGELRVFGIYQDISDRVAMKNALEDEKLFFQSLYENVPFAVVLLDDKERLIDCNEVFVSMFGFSRHELLQSGDIGLIIPEKFAGEGKSLRSSVLGGENVYHETVRKRKDEQIVNVAITAKRVIRKNGKQLIFAFYEDISQRKLVEAALIERERELSAIVKYLPGMVYRCEAEKEYRVYFASEGTMRVTGYSPEDFTTHKLTFNEIILPEYRDVLWQKWQQIIKGGTIFNAEYRITAADGSIRWVWERGRPVFDESNHVLFLEGYIEDITERFNIQHDLWQERDLLQSLMDNIPDTIYFKDRQSCFIRVNLAQAGMLGLHSPAEAVGKTDFDFFNEEHAKIAFEDEQKMMETGAAVINKQEYINTALGWRWFSATKVPLHNSEGEIIGLAGVSRDITEIKTMEEKVLESEDHLRKINAEKDKLFSVIAHDLRSPFNSFLLLTEIFADEYLSFDQDEMQNLANSLHRAATNVSELLENLLSWSALQRGMVNYELRLINLNELVKKNLDLYNNQFINKEIAIETDVNQVISVYADYNFLSSVVRNLLSNAVKFTPRGGKIEVRVTNPSQDKVAIAISDSGIGMPEDLIQKLFSVDITGRKGTESEPSSGLGLILVKEFIDKMGGSIHVESEVDKGTTFTVILPASKAKE